MMKEFSTYIILNRSRKMNILLTSVGRRSYLVKYFKEAVGENGEVHVSNSNTITPALYTQIKYSYSADL